MKNVMNTSKKVFLMVALMATVMGYANDSKSFYISKNDANRTTLTLNDVKVGNLFTIKDENGITLYKESIQKRGMYTKGFDLTALPNGNYFFELEKDVEVSTIPFTVSSNKVLFKKELAKTVFKPVTVTKDNLVLISKLSLNNAPLKIEIFFAGTAFNDDYELVYAETLKDFKKTIERIYKLSGLDYGNYKIVYTTEGREFVEFI